MFLPDFMGFVKFMATHRITFNRLLGTNKTSSKVARIALHFIHIFEKDTKKALEHSKKGYLPLSDIWHLEEKVKDVLSIGNQTGEGWFLTAEMIEYIENDIASLPESSRNDRMAKVKKAQQAIKTFNESIVALRQQGTVVVEEMRAKVAEDALRMGDAIAKQTTGRSAEELQNMSEEEMEAMTNDLVAQRLAAAGLGNMSLADLQALEGKSDAEILQAMQGAKPVSAQQASVAMNMQAEADFQRVAAEYLKIKKQTQAMMITSVEADLAKIYEKHKSALCEKLKALLQESDKADEGKWDKSAYNTAQLNYQAVKEAYLKECFIYLNAATRGMMKYCSETAQKSLPEMKNPKADKAGMGAYDIAGLYLELAESITMYSLRLPTAGETN